MLITTTTINKFEIYYMDWKIIFINGDLNEKIYIKQSYGFVVRKKEKKNYKLVKLLYGLNKLLNNDIKNISLKYSKNTK